MELRDLYIKLKEIELADHNFYLNGLYGSSDDTNKLALSIKKIKNEMLFEIYHKEKGVKSILASFNNEAEACKYIFDYFLRWKETKNKYGF